MNWKTLRSLIAESLNLEDVRNLCFDLDLDFDSLRGEGKEGKIRELIAICRQRDLLPNLISELKKARPNFDWEELLTKKPETTLVSTEFFNTRLTKNSTSIVLITIVGLFLLIYLIFVLGNQEKHLSNQNANLAVPTLINQPTGLAYPYPIENDYSSVAYPAESPSPNQLPVVENSAPPSLSVTPLSITPVSEETALITNPIAIVNTPILPNNQLGTLLSTSTETCNSATVTIKKTEEIVATGELNEPIWLATGTYTVILTGDMPGELVRENVSIRANETTEIDFSDGLGSLIVNSYESFTNAPIMEYHVKGQGKRYDTGMQYCGVASQYTLSLIDAYTYVYTWDNCVYPCSLDIDVQIGLFDEIETEFNVEIAVGKVTVVGPELWPLQLGILTFVRDSYPSQLYLNFELTNLLSGETSTKRLDGEGSYWIPVGSYKVIMNAPYAGITYEGVIISINAETILQLPASTLSQSQ